MSPIYDYIVSQAIKNGCRPKIAKVLIGTGHYGLAWNTKEYYVTIETFENEKKANITFSFDRHNLKIIDMDDLDEPSTNEYLNEYLSDIFTRIKEIQNESSG